VTRAFEGKEEGAKRVPNTLENEQNNIKENNKKE